MALSSRKSRTHGHAGPISNRFYCRFALVKPPKFAHYLTDADKTYVATLKLGVTTNTGDAEGEVLERHEVNVSRNAV